MDTAYFIPDPSRLEDLIVPHFIADEHPYEIVKRIQLGSIEYENFVTDLLADREFIERNYDICSKGDVWRCLLIQRSGQKDGVLVLPEDGCYVGYAAYVRDVKI